MSTNMTTWKDGLGANLKDFEDASTNLSDASGGSKSRRISVNGSRFRKMVGGEQVEVSNSSSMNIIIVNAAPVSRTFYAGNYDPENPAPPACWSQDANAGIPAKDVTDEGRQSSRCGDCPQNVKGSGQGQSRACRFNQRLAVAIEGDLDNIYQLQLAATSIFGQAVNGNMPMGAYAKYLKEHSAPASAIVTQMYFDESASVPKLFFKPVRPLDEDELNTIRGKLKSEDTMRAIELTVAQTDGVDTKPKLEAPAKEAPKKVAPKEEVIEEPKKATKPSAAVNKESLDSALDEVIDEWDD